MDYSIRIWYRYIKSNKTGHVEVCDNRQRPTISKREPLGGTLPGGVT